MLNQIEHNQNESRMWMIPSKKIRNKIMGIYKDKCRLQMQNDSELHNSVQHMFQNKKIQNLIFLFKSHTLNTEASAKIHIETEILYKC